MPSDKPTAPSLAPTRFYFSFHNAWSFPHYRVEWLPDKRCLSHNNLFGKGTEHTVPEARWQAFWNEAKLMGIWAWPDEFNEPEGYHTLDGHSWEMEIVHAGLRLRTSGDNAYPPGLDDLDTHGDETLGHTHQFARLLRAVKALTDGSSV